MFDVWWCIVWIVCVAKHAPSDVLCAVLCLTAWLLNSGVYWCWGWTWQQQRWWVTTFIMYQGHCCQEIWLGLTSHLGSGGCCFCNLIYFWYLIYLSWQDCQQLHFLQKLIINNVILFLLYWLLVFRCGSTSRTCHVRPSGVTFKIWAVIYCL